jgi:hypothetical protein
MNKQAEGNFQWSGKGRIAVLFWYFFQVTNREWVYEKIA